ncbi:MAG: secretin and TonB N-terminal domain-containing protein, partial [Gammaproteobacteria bacterium]|nr:secretin and TonB N-terminal domain-containing protein [Gammaproteobacteria bacterium]
MLYRIRQTTIFLGVVFYAAFLSQAAVAAVLSTAPMPRAQVITLDDIVLRANEQNNVQVVLRFSDAVSTPQNFSVEDPPTIAFDFNHVKNKTSREALQTISATGVLQNVDILESNDKTRVVLNLVKMVRFDLKVNKNEVLIDLDPIQSSEKPMIKKIAKSSEAYNIQSFDFRRGDNGEGRLIVSLSSTKASVDVIEALNQTTLAFVGASIEDKLLKKYDVVDFATPIHGFEITRDDGVVNISVSTTNDYNKIVYQLDNQFILEARPKKNDDKVLDNTISSYSGNKISLNFQNIEIRSVLQIIADFSKFNMIASDSVRGNITLRLDNIPWDQALDIILKSKGLDKRQAGNVMMVGSSDELASREKSELENQKQVQELGILRSELIQINYAQADDIATMLKDKTNSLLTSRGNVTVDKRTNTLLIQDIPVKIMEVQAL